MKKMKSAGWLVLVLAIAFSLNVMAKSITNSDGRVFTVPTPSETADTYGNDEQVDDQSIKATEGDRRGLLVAYVSARRFDNGEITNADLNCGLGVTLPKNAILTGEAYIDTSQVYAPTSTTYAFALRLGSTNLYTFPGNSLAAGVLRTNLSLVVSKTTSDYSVVFYATGNAPTGFASTLYIPYYLGLGD